MTKRPSEGWLRRMAEEEDRARSVSVGGLAEVVGARVVGEELPDPEQPDPEPEGLEFDGDLGPGDADPDEEDLAGDQVADADEAPWSPVPVAVARRWMTDNPDAQLGIVFPTVYEEDRSSKLKDLGFAQGMDFISHRRAAEQSAQELGYEDYDYDAEMEEIARERQNAFLQPALGRADDMALGMLGLKPPESGAGGPGASASGPPSPSAKVPQARLAPPGGVNGRPAPRGDAAGPGHPEPAAGDRRREPMAGDNRQQFRRDQRSAGR